MIRLRKKDKSSIEIPQGVFVEICDTDGKIGRLIYLDGAGRIQVVEAADAQAQAYATLMGAEFCPVITLPKR